MGRRLVHFALPLLLLLATAALDPASAKQHRAAKGALHHKKAAQHKKAVHHKKVAHHRKVRGYQGKGMRRQSQAPCFVGVNYGLGLSTHPIPVPKAISIIQGMGASGVKLWAPDRSAYAALAGTGMEVITGVLPFNETNIFAVNDTASQLWVDHNIVPFYPQVNFVAITVANEVIDVDARGDAWKVVPAMWSLHRALQMRGLDKHIKVVAPMRAEIAQTPIPPSRSKVPASIAPLLKDLFDFLNRTESSYFITAYPFYPLKNNWPPLDRDFAFFEGLNGYWDKGGLYYQNYFDAMLDSVYWMMESMGHKTIPIEVGETGWPTGGDPAAGRGAVSPAAAAAEWNKALLGKVCSGQGTPKRPGQNIRVWFFEAFDEDLKYEPGRPWESHWGIHNMDGTPKYAINFKTPYPAPPVKPPLRYCVVRPGADQEEVRDSVAWACSPQGGKLNCNWINQVCPYQVAASAVFNMFYQLHFQNNGTCYFKGNAMVTYTKPVAPKSPCPFRGIPYL